MTPTPIVGTAGWSIATDARAAFPDAGTALERYAARFAGVEINSSFHRRHRASTWARWASLVPDDFRFSVKLPKTITHQAKLIDTAALLDEFAADIAPLGAKHEITLVQLPPSLAFSATAAQPFFDDLRARVAAAIVCEPRHPSWFEEEADHFLAGRHIARVAADPAIVPAGAVPGGWRELAYWRLHGSPAMYRSSYDDERLDAYRAAIAAKLAAGVRTWCMFDNTASSAATGNALTLTARLGGGRGAPRR